ncbi:MAG: anion permease [Proteobacteria bacterium]|nr:anion permease [Pseudomonadota bacterium]
MTHSQMLAFALILGTLAMFVWGRVRYDLVALGSLLAGVLLGVIPAKTAFDGFKNDVVLIIAMALVVSAAFARSGIVEVALRPILGRLNNERTQVPALVSATALLSMATKNVGALAILMPVASQLSRRTGTSISRLLMPMAFASLLGGLVTLVGTSPNIIVSEVREHTLGKPFAMYDFAPVGLSLTAVGLVFLAFAYPLLPRNRTGKTALNEVLASNSYVTEAEAPEDFTPRRIRRVNTLGGGAVTISALIRDGKRRSAPHPNTLLRAGDVVVLEGEENALHRLIADLKLKPHRADHPIERAGGKGEVRSIEVVVDPGSELVGATPKRVDLQGRFNVKVLAVSRSGGRTVRRLQAAAIQAGDVLLLRGAETDLSSALSELGLLPLAERTVQLGAKRPLILPAVILATAMILVALKVLPIAIAFFAAAFAMVAFRCIPMREAYCALEGPVLVLIAALIPVSEALQSTGGVELIASTLSQWFSGAPAWLVLGALLTASMLAAPFLHNAPTVLILGPVAVGVAKRLGIAPDPLLMGVALGAACDFLTPVGHQCNTLVMAPGGYRFIDYPRLGAPLSLLVICAGTPLIAFFWPLHPH